MPPRTADEELDKAREIYNRAGDSDKLTQAEIDEIERLMEKRERKQNDD